MRIFLDANILFSAAKSDGGVRCLLTRLLATPLGCEILVTGDRSHFGRFYRRSLARALVAEGPRLAPGARSSRHPRAL
jgi:hypothetical protein